MKYGIDVAQWQGNIDWSKVKKDFAILKVTKKDNTIEPKFLVNYKGATANGIPVGVYRYVYAKNTTQAKVEADAIVKVLLGLQITCGVWLDMEDSSIKSLGKNNLTNIINVMANTLKASGLKVGIYCNRDWFLNVLDGSRLAKTYPFWIARYPLRDTGAFNPNSTISPKAYAKAWQYSQKGKVNGIKDDVDMDVLFDDALIGAVPVNDAYYPKYTGNSTSIVSALAAVGEKDTSKAHRTKLAKANGITNYTGTAVQNIELVNKLKKGQLKRA
ncbi:Lyzozyme M1 (1,4-beta-N-acetylmuramidase), GH25 family [Pseudobutyrivibrio sp. OR37]|uniref:GH25 family lysozyme n=1 Tax=Pseudobutyrivibrio sp. OR37 TaxID=1798186 RepID=UPI0008E15183|nr:GH25 family lysozyme [Pseudobutyrivibrio sp. OR37]SFI36047.1 Lyzozyme M1 (1,4-beta-N-acetylmuramidase), GH25 family [Pseudobutyrivibrio sp. OR37]